MKKLFVLLVVCISVFVGMLITSFASEIIGDVNDDGRITAADARLVLRHSASLELLPDTVLPNADADGNGRITAADARLILRVSANLDSFKEKNPTTELTTEKQTSAKPEETTSAKPEETTVVITEEPTSAKSEDTTVSDEPEIIVRTGDDVIYSDEVRIFMESEYYLNGTVNVEGSMPLPMSIASINDAFYMEYPAGNINIGVYFNAKDLYMTIPDKGVYTPINRTFLAAFQIDLDLNEFKNIANDDTPLVNVTSYTQQIDKSTESAKYVFEYLDGDKVIIMTVNGKLTSVEQYENDTKGISIQVESITEDIPQNIRFPLQHMRKVSGTAFISYVLDGVPPMIFAPIEEW